MTGSWYSDRARLHVSPLPDLFTSSSRVVVVDGVVPTEGNLSVTAPCFTCSLLNCRDVSGIQGTLVGVRRTTLDLRINLTSLQSLLKLVLF